MVRNRLGGGGGGAQYLWVELVRPQSQRRCAWAAWLCDWWSAMQLSPLPLPAKEVQQRRQNQTAQDSAAEATFLWSSRKDAVSRATRDELDYNTDLISCSAAASSTRNLSNSISVESQVIFGFYIFIYKLTSSGFNSPHWENRLRVIMGRQGHDTSAPAPGLRIQRSQSKMSLSASFEALAVYFPCMNSFDEEDGGKMTTGEMTQPRPLAGGSSAGWTEGWQWGGEMQGYWLCRDLKDVSLIRMAAQFRSCEAGAVWHGYWSRFVVKEQQCFCLCYCCQWYCSVTCCLCLSNQSVICPWWV